MQERDVIEGAYRVIQGGDPGGWKGGEPIFQEGGIGRLVYVVLMIAFAKILFHWLL